MFTDMPTSVRRTTQGGQEPRCGQRVGRNPGAGKGDGQHETKRPSKGKSVLMFK